MGLLSSISSLINKLADSSYNNTVGVQTNTTSKNGTVSSGNSTVKNQTSTTTSSVTKPATNGGTSSAKPSTGTKANTGTNTNLKTNTNLPTTKTEAKNNTSGGTSANASSGTKTTTVLDQKAGNTGTSKGTSSAYTGTTVSSSGVTASNPYSTHTNLASNPTVVNAATQKATPNTSSSTPVASGSPALQTTQTFTPTTNTYTRLDNIANTDPVTQLYNSVATDTNPSTGSTLSAAEQNFVNKILGTSVIPDEPTTVTTTQTYAPELDPNKTYTYKNQESGQVATDIKDTNTTASDVSNGSGGNNGSVSSNSTATEKPVSSGQVAADGASSGQSTSMPTTIADFQNLLYDAYQNGTIEETLAKYGITMPEAIAQAMEKLTPSYRENLKSQLSSLNKKALKGGFYGQLPAQALYQQAVASNEAELQAAIYDLAEQLYNDSLTNATTIQKTANGTNDSKLDILMQLLELNPEYQKTYGKYATSGTGSNGVTAGKYQGVQYNNDGLASSDIKKIQAGMGLPQTGYYTTDVQSAAKGLTAQEAYSIYVDAPTKQTINLNNQLEENGNRGIWDQNQAINYVASIWDKLTVAQRITVQDILNREYGIKYNVFL